jgi:hypothetical protein
MLKARPPAFNQYATSQSVPSTSPGTTLTGGTANTKGSYAQLVSSLDFDAQLLIVNFATGATAATDTSALVDVAIGAAASESILIPDLLAGWAPPTADAGSPRHYIFPLYVPSGSRISARVASVVASGTVACWVSLYGGLSDSEAWWCGEQVVAYGITSASSKGTTVTPGASNAEGSWTSIGTTSQDHKAVVPGIQLADTTAASNTGVTLDIGIATASTSILRENYRAGYDASERLSQYGVWWPIMEPVASGDVLAARASVPGTADDLDVALYGIS